MSIDCLASTQLSSYVCLGSRGCLCAVVQSSRQYQLSSHFSNVFHVNSPVNIFSVYATPQTADISCTSNLCRNLLFMDCTSMYILYRWSDLLGIDRLPTKHLEYSIFNCWTVSCEIYTLVRGSH